MKKNHRWIFSVATVVVVICGSLTMSLSAETVPTTKPEAMLDAIARLEERIRQLEQVQDMSARISKNAGASVALIVGEYIWTDRTGRKPLRYEEESGAKGHQQNAREAVTFDGDGQIVVGEFQGTGFLIDSTHLLTSTFLLNPWESDPLLDASENPRLVPSIRVLHAYLPGVPKPIDIKIDRPAESLEAVICLLQQPVPNEMVSISREHVAAGDSILLLGYPGGVDMLASRVPDDVRHELYAFGQPPLDDAAQLLAERGYIAPIAMQTSVSGQTDNRIFFETFATEGSTGGPIFNVNGNVVAINQAIYPEHPSSNMAAVLAPLQSWIADAASR